MFNILENLRMLGTGTDIDVSIEYIQNNVASLGNNLSANNAIFTLL